MTAGEREYLTQQSLISERMAIPDKSWQPPLVTLETSMGDVTIELYWKHAPITCRNFAELARRGYYNGTKFHRIIKVNELKMVYFI